MLIQKIALSRSQHQILIVLELLFPLRIPILSVKLQESFAF